MKAIIISYGLTFFDNVPRRMDLTVLLLKCHVTSSYSLLNVFLLSPNPLGWKCQNTTFLFGHLQICVWYSLPQTHVCINMKILKLSLNIPLLISKLKVLDKDILFFSGHAWINVYGAFYFVYKDAQRRTICIWYSLFPDRTLLRGIWTLSSTSFYLSHLKTFTASKSI